MKEVEDLLIDKLYSGEETIEVFARLKVTEVLENEILDSVVSNIFQGRYVRETIFAKSTAYQALLEGYYNISGEDYEAINALAIVEYRHEYSTFTDDNQYIEGNSTGLTLRFGKRKEKQTYKYADHKMFEKGHMFQFYVWKESFDSQHYFNILCALLLGIELLIAATSLVDETRDIEAILGTVNHPNELPDEEKNKLRFKSSQYSEALLLLMGL